MSFREREGSFEKALEQHQDDSEEYRTALLQVVNTADYLRLWMADREMAPDADLLVRLTTLVVKRAQAISDAEDRDYERQYLPVRRKS